MQGPKDVWCLTNNHLQLSPRAFLGYFSEYSMHSDHKSHPRELEASITWERVHSRVFVTRS